MRLPISDWNFSNSVTRGREDPRFTAIEQNRDDKRFVEAAAGEGVELSMESTNRTQRKEGSSGFRDVFLDGPTWTEIVLPPGTQAQGTLLCGNGLFSNVNGGQRRSAFGKGDLRARAHALVSACACAHALGSA